MSGLTDDLGEEVGEVTPVFAVRLQPAREVVWVNLIGELDLAAGPELRQQVSELLAVGFARLMIDLRGLAFIDATGVTLLLSLADQARAEGWQLSLIPSDGQVRRMFAVTSTVVRLPFRCLPDIGE